MDICRHLSRDTQAEIPIQSDLFESGHGTCVGSKINGPRYGVAKQVNLVVVKSTQRASDQFDAFVKIYKDIQEGKLQGKSVIDYSSGCMFHRFLCEMTFADSKW